MKDNTKLIWKIDPGHSTVQFKVKHMAIANVSGNFGVFEGNAQCQNEDFEGAEINLEIDADSLSTQNKERDDHLRSGIFFDVQQFPKLTFSGSLEKKNDDYELAGDLTIRGITRSIKLGAEFTGTGKGRFGDYRAGFELNGKINRKDFGLTWNMLTETGGLIVGEDIALHMDIELIKLDK